MARTLAASYKGRLPGLVTSDGADVRGLRAFLALLDVELHALVLLQAPVAGRLDRAEVDEDVGLAAVRGDEAVPLLAVEPLHGALCYGGASPSVGAVRRGPCVERRAAAVFDFPPRSGAPGRRIDEALYG